MFPLPLLCEIFLKILKNCKKLKNATNAVFLGCDVVWLLLDRCFGGTYRLLYHGEVTQRATDSVNSNWQLKQAAMKLPPRT
jgi:hypothetical protein